MLLILTFSEDTEQPTGLLAIPSTRKGALWRNKLCSLIQCGRLIRYNTRHLVKSEFQINNEYILIIKTNSIQHTYTEKVFVLILLFAKYASPGPRACPRVSTFIHFCWKKKNKKKKEIVRKNSHKTKPADWIPWFFCLCVPSTLSMLDLC